MPKNDENSPTEATKNRLKSIVKGHSCFHKILISRDIYLIEVSMFI